MQRCKACWGLVERVAGTACLLAPDQRLIPPLLRLRYAASLPPVLLPALLPVLQGYQMTIYNQILYVTSFSACFSLLGLLSAGQLMPAIRWVVCARGVAVVAVCGSEGGAVGGWEAHHSCWQVRLLPGSRCIAFPTTACPALLALTHPPQPNVTTPCVCLSAAS